MADNIAPLMFSVAISKLDEKIKKWQHQIEDFASNGGKGYKLKIDFGEADTMLRTLAQLSKTAELTRLQTELDALKKKFKELNNSIGGNTAQNIFEPLRRGADEGKKVADTIEQNKKRILDAYSDLMKSVNSLQADRAHAHGLGIDIGGSSKMVQDIKAFAAELNRISGKNGILGDSSAINDILSKYRNYTEVIRMLRNEVVSLSKDQERQSRNAASQKIIDNKSVNEAIYQIAQLEKRLSALRDLQGKAQNAGIMTPKLDALVKDLERYMQRFQQIVQNGGRLSDGVTTSGMIKAEGDYRALTARITENTRETRLNIAARSSAIALTSALAAEEQRLSQAITSSTSAMHGQSQVLKDLKTLATQYFSVWGAKTILDNIIQTGGLLEQQRLSIGAILGDLHQANALFDQIKDLAIRSPFGVVQLDSFSKQLTAYGFKSHELYDWTRRLGDISAATGTEVSRLALALGHVRSEGALTGYTLRQFAMGNVPLLKMLSEQLGVTTAQIREMTRKKQISFEDVTTALKTLTDGNGMFANAQETMAEALNAKFKNLRDAFDLMWGDIAESGVGDTLKSIATGLTELTKSWKPLVKDMAAGAAMFGAVKAAALLYNSALGQTTSSTLASALATKKHEAEQLRIARTYRSLTTVEQIRMNTAGQLNAIDLRMLLNTQKLRGEELLRAVAMGKVNKQMAISAVNASNLANTEKQLLATQLQQLNGLRRGAMMWTTFANSMKRAGAAVVSFMAQMAPMAAIMLVTDAWASRQADKDAIKKRMDDMREQATEGYRNLQELQKNFAVGSSKGMNDTLLSQSIDDMVDKLKDYAANANEAFNNAFEIDKEGKAVHTLAEQYEILAKALSVTTEAYKKYHEILPLIERALQSSDPDLNFIERIGNSAFGWMLNDNAKASLTGGLTAALDAYTTKVKEATVAENVFLRQRMEVANVLQGLGYANVLEMDNDELLHLIRTIKNEVPDTFRKFYQLLGEDGKNALNNLTMSWRGMNEAYSLANLRMRKAGEELHESMKAMWGNDMQKWPEGWREVVMLAMNSATADVKGFADLSIDYQNLVRDSFLKPFKITVDSEEAQQRVNNLLVDLQNLVGKEWVVNIGVKGEDSFADVDASQKAYKDAQEKIKRAQQQLKKLGNPKIGDKNISEEAKKVIEDYNTQIARRSAARSVIISYGATPEEPKVKNTGNARNRTEDALANRWQSRIDILKKYRSELEKYQKVMSREQAIEKLSKNGNYAPMFKEKWFSDPNDFVGSIDEAIKKLGDATDKRKELIAKWGTEKEDFLGDEFRKSIERSVSELGRLMSVVAENYDTYKKWVDLTGDTSLAANIAGISENTSMSDWLESRMTDELRKNGDSRSASQIFGLNESAVKELGEDSVIYKLWEEWQKNNDKIKKENLALYAEAIKNAKGYAEKIADINRELQKEIEAIKEMTGGNTPTEDQQTQRTVLIKNANDTANKKIADETWNNFKATEEWGRIFADLDRVSTSTLSRMLDKLREIAPTLNGSVESTKAVYEAIEKVTNVVNGRNPFKAIGESLSNRSKLSGYYHQAQEKGNLVANSELSKLLGVKLGSTVSKDQIKDGMKNESESFQKAIGKVVEGLQTFQNGLDLVGGVFDSLGMSGASNFASDASGILGGAMQGASALSALGPWGMAAGAGLGLISGFAQVHDKRLERQIEKLREDVTKIENNTALIVKARERTLGYDSGDLRRTYQIQYAPDQKLIDQYGKYGRWLGSLAKGFTSEAQKAMYEYYQQNNKGTGYKQEYENLKKERQDYIDMYNAEYDKKKSSDAALEEYKKKIAELDDQIHYFALDLAKELWNIDLKGWAQQLTDALATAFENGTDMAKAYKNTVEDILRSLANKMIQLKIIEPIFQSLQDELFGYQKADGTWTNGVFDKENPLGSADAVVKVVSQFFGKGGKGEQAIEASKAFLEAYERALNQDGLSIKNVDTSSLSGSIKSITEETADILASYVNAIRADVAVNRMLLTQFVSEYWGAYMQQITGIHSTLQNIDKNVAAITALMSENGALYDIIASINTHLERYNTGVEKITVQ